MQNRLLLLACSQRKRLDVELLPAIERYDGGMYRVVKKLQRENRFPDGLDILILSAEFGIISPETMIPYYDRLMTNHRATELAQEVADVLANYFDTHHYEQIVLSVGKIYLRALSSTVWPDGSKVATVPGRVGEKLKLTKQWILQPKEAKQFLCWI